MAAAAEGRGGNERGREGRRGRKGKGRRGEGAAGHGEGVSHLIATRAARQARSLPSVGLRRASALVSGSPVPGALPRQGKRGGVARAVWAAGL